MTIQFEKYQGTGNDFILVDGIANPLDLSQLSQAAIAKICDRHFGVGADGFIILSSKENYDFEMIYYNSDGRQSTMCGNGGRCAVAFANQLGIIDQQAHFLAIDGPHEAGISTDGIVSLLMQPVTEIQEFETFHQLNTGSPHYVTYVEDVKQLAVDKEGALIRYSPRFKDEGINVNFVEAISASELFVRTYERGVEDETLSCGTGVTACALVQMTKTGNDRIQVNTLGGSLQVSAKHSAGSFEDIYLIGPATFVFKGAYTFA